TRWSAACAGCACWPRTGRSTTTRPSTPRSVTSGRAGTTADVPPGGPEGSGQGVLDLGDPGQQPVDEPGRVVGGQRLHEVHGLGHGDAVGDLVVPDDLPGPDPQRGPVDRRHPVQRPALGPRG